MKSSHEKTETHTQRGACTPTPIIKLKPQSRTNISIAYKLSELAIYSKEILPFSNIYDK